MDARYANRRKSSRHQPAVPLYTSEDAQQALKAFRPQPFSEPFEPVSGVEVLFSPVGHILGAAAVGVADENTSVLFTGDVGRPVDPVMKAPAPLADHVVTESTYGDRIHEQSDPSDGLADVVVRTMERGGTLLIPVFAVGRAQTALHLLSELTSSGRIPSFPIYVNSPMAASVTDLFCDHIDEHRLTVQQCEAMCEDVVFVRSVEESKQLTSRSGPMIVLSASGMLTGGRVLHHLQQVAPDDRSTVLLVGYQAAGTRGQALLAGANKVKVYGTYVPVRAEVATIDGLSAHADAEELTDWFRSSELAPRTTHIVHGEPASADALRRSLRDDLGWSTNVPAHGDAVELV